MKLAAIAFTARGAVLGRHITAAIAAGGDVCSLAVPARLAAGAGAQPFDTLEQWTAEHFSSADALLFVGACGIAVRAVAPHVRDKLTDPAVVSVDEGGAWCVPLLSGHVGGANDLARRVAAITGGAAAVSTATDVNGVFAVDQWAARRSWSIDGRAAAKKISAALLAGETVGFAADYPLRGALPAGVREGAASLGFAVTARCSAAPFAETLRVIPRVLRLGIGCRRGTGAHVIAAVVDRVLEENDLSPGAVCAVCTIDLKKDEPGLLDFCRERGWPLECYSAAALRAVEGEFTPSAFVAGVTGVDNVCERAATLGGAALLVRKQAANGVTAAVAAIPLEISFLEDEV